MTYTEVDSQCGSTSRYHDDFPLYIKMRRQFGVKIQTLNLVFSK